MFSIIEDLTNTEHDHKTVVLDVLDGFEKLAKEYVCAKDFKNDWSTRGFANYAAGDKAVANGPMRELVVALDKLREVKRIGIICLAHTSVGNMRNPLGPDYDRFVPDMYKDSWNLFYGWADIVLFGLHEIVASKEKGEQKAKAAGGEVRIMRTVYDASSDAKNRHNLPAEIEMGNSGKEAWNNFKTALIEGRKATVTNV